MSAYSDLNSPSSHACPHNSPTEEVSIFTGHSPAVSDVASDLSGSSTESISVSVSESNNIICNIPATKKGGTLKKNALARNETWQFFHLYNEKEFS
jgi:hypothetical protein